LGGVQHEAAQAQAKVVRTESGYVVEAAVPLETDVWRIQPEHGGVLGFQVHLNGASTSSRNLKVIWSKFDQSDSSHYDPSVFGELIFYEIGQTEPARIESEVSAEEALLPVDENALFKQADAPIPDRVDDLLAHMTLAEKIGQMTLVEKNSIRKNDITNLHIGGLLSGGGGYPEAGNTPEKWAEMVNGFQVYALESHLGIPLIYGVDAVHGHSNVVGAVIFPHNIGLGAANDLELMEEIGQATAREMAATGIFWNYAPGVMVPQDIRWGRTYEGFGEDPNLVSPLAAAYLRGLQSPDLLPSHTVIGTPKHYVGDGGTSFGTSTNGSLLDQGVTEVDEDTLRTVHLPPYSAAIEAGARSVMVSYSSWGGKKMHAQRYLIMDVLKGELGFTGFVVSDWGAIDRISGDYYQAVVTAINAGIDMNMVPHNYIRFINTLTKAVKEGDVLQSRIDDAVRRILTVKFEMGLFEQPYSLPDLLPEVGSDEHRSLAREAVSKSLVLLKNEGELLPLSKNLSYIYVAGTAADDIGIQSGGWTIEWQGKKGDITPGTTILEGIQAAADEDMVVEYSLSGIFEGDPSNPEAVCLGVVGELPYAEGRGDSRTLNLPPGENRALRKLERECANLIVILVSGRPLIITEVLEEWDALVATWLPGTEGGGVADVLFGEVPFSGKLPYTWPASTDQLPLGSSHDIPLFPYGFGLVSGGD
jgi:beta-glucosidase